MAGKDKRLQAAEDLRGLKHTVDVLYDAWATGSIVGCRTQIDEIRRVLHNTESILKDDAYRDYVDRRETLATQAKELAAEQKAGRRKS